ncbi:hypothetical protein L2E82_50774 [Cichorium intybus]|nr:hypothetical protein L2E82_50774 [Cichorium intybus]
MVNISNQGVICIPISIEQGSATPLTSKGLMNTTFSIPTLTMVAGNEANKVKIFILSYAQRKHYRIGIKILNLSGMNDQNITLLYEIECFLIFHSNKPARRKYWKTMTNGVKFCYATKPLGVSSLSSCGGYPNICLSSF